MSAPVSAKKRYFSLWLPGALAAAAALAILCGQRPHSEATRSGDAPQFIAPGNPLCRRPAASDASSVSFTPRPAEKTHPAEPRVDRSPALPGTFSLLKLNDGQMTVFDTRNGIIRDFANAKVLAAIPALPCGACGTYQATVSADGKRVIVLDTATGKTWTHPLPPAGQ